MNLAANHLWQSTVFAAAACLLTLAFRGNRAAVRYAIWLAASLKFLLPFSLLAMAATAWLPHAPLPAAAPGHLVPALQQIGQPFAASSPAGVAATPSYWSGALLALWITGASYHLFSWARQWRRVRAAARTARPLPIAAPIPVLATAGEFDPGVFGIFRPVLLLPEEALQHLSPQQLRAILIHEVEHVRRRDNLAAGAHALVEAIFWFHPLVWWIESRLLEERERACDEAVLRQGGAPEAYAESILYLCRRFAQAPLPCVSGVAGADLKTRIAEIMLPRAVRKVSAARKLLLAAAAAACVAFPLVIAQTPSKFAVTSIKSDDSPPPWRIGLETHPGGRVHYTGPLVFLLAIAYDVPFNSKRLTGIPDWGYKEPYVIDAVPDAGAIPPDLGTLAVQERIRPMLQALLADRFHLVIRREGQETPVYALTVAKGGPKLRPAGIEEKDCAVDGKIDCHSLHGGITGVFGKAANLDDFAQFISNWTDRPVINRTSLNGLYQIQTEGFGPMFMGSAASGRNPNETELLADPNRPTIAMVLREMGLRLEPAKASLDFYVIEQVERPSAN